LAVRVGGVAQRSIWLADDGLTVEIIDQTRLPFEFVVARLARLADAVEAIRTMQVRGAPLIGVTAAYGLCLALRADASDAALEVASKSLLATRPTAVNLRWALDEMREALRELPPSERVAAGYAKAAALADADADTCRSIGEHGFALIEQAFEARGKRAPVNVLTHCNAGWLACVDWGTALAPVYLAHERGTPVHVWVDETRPRNQGASLTAWELGEHGVPHTVVTDNAGGHLMQRGRVDLCLMGTDRTTATGDVCNKIGTYLKALAARENGVPFYVAAPSSSIDWSLDDGLAQIPIEERAGREVSHVAGLAPGHRRVEVAILPDKSPVSNFAFDVTPAHLVTALVTECGVCEASREGLLSLFPERRPGGQQGRR
jgi:methylthioribose-1-phosphate isomerase